MIDTLDILKGTYTGKEVTVCGWVKTSRDSKNMAFLEINDGTALKHLQIVIDKDKLGEIDKFSKLGSALQVVGTVVKSEIVEGNLELNASKIELIGDCPLDYPIQKKRTTLEFLRTIPHLRLRTNTFNAVFRIRSVLAGLIHEFFLKRNFIYLNTPLITGSDCEGAGAVFRVTTHEFNHNQKSEEDYYKNDFFGARAGLSVSGQLEGENGALAFKKIYTFGPSFRAEKSNTVRHLAEFWHIEPEIAFANLEDVLALAEEMFVFLIKGILKKCPDELQFFEKHYKKDLIKTLKSLIKEKFATIEYTDAIEVLKNSGVEFAYPVEWGQDLQTEHERYITEVHFKKPVFVINYPKDIKSFYMKLNDDGKTVAASDLLVPEVGELIGGSEREADLDKLLDAMKKRNMPLEPYQDYIELRKFGSVPHGGFGLGFERLIMYITGLSNIRDVIMHPRAVGSIR